MSKAFYREKKELQYVTPLTDQTTRQRAGMIVKLFHDFPNPLLGILTDIPVFIKHVGHGADRYPRSFGDILYGRLSPGSCHRHTPPFPCLIFNVVLLRHNF